jgi:hypothetical protein
LFFKLLCNIETSQLPDIEKQFKHLGYRVIAQKTFFGDFIVSNVFKK